jgi:fructose-1,6-bisphosphatase/inositol monophosphatase family enzyme
VPHFDSNSDDRDILGFLHDVADAAADIIDETGVWEFTGEREGQYSGDVAVDEVVVDMCEAAGFFVLSEESGVGDLEWPLPENKLLIVVDPVDGSTNASKGFPWFATSLCVVDSVGPRVALVAEQSGSETRYAAIRGAGANVDGMRIRVSGQTDPARAVVGTNALPAPGHGWWQVRTLGAAALDISLVGRGGLDGFIDYDGLGVWDYLAAVLICAEAGAVIAEANDEDLMTIDTDARRRPVIASSPEMLASLMASRRQ